MTTTDSTNMLSAAIHEISKQSMTKCVDALSTKYNFDKSEAEAFLNLDSLNITIQPSVQNADPKQKNGKRDKVLNSELTTKMKPPRQPSGYMLFSTHFRPHVKKELSPDLSTKPTEVLKALATKWNALSDLDKQHWKLKARGVNPPSPPN
jgi:hypothetical protein